MWCPKCKNEYVTGITKCSDCNVDLVEELTDTVVLSEKSDFEEDIEEAKEALCSQIDQDDEADDLVNPFGNEKSSHAYIEKSAKYEDVKSTAYTFTVIGILGIAFIILFDIGILPISLAAYMKIMMNLVMGALFVIFTFVGIRSFLQLKSLKGEVSEEEIMTAEIKEWFLTEQKAMEIDTQISVDTLSEEQLYFKRYDVMKQMILAKYDCLSEDYLDHLIELFYVEIFE